MSFSFSIRRRGTAIGWVVFILLTLPILIFAVGIGISNGLTTGRVAVALGEVAFVTAAAWLLGHGLSRSSRAMVTVAVLLILLILIAYGAAAALLLGGLHIKIF